MAHYFTGICLILDLINLQQLELISVTSVTVIYVTVNTVPIFYIILCHANSSCNG